MYALSGVEFSISLLLSRLTLILHDPQYNFTTAQRMALLAGQALTVARSLLWPLLASAAVCAVLYLIKKQPVTVGRLLNLWAAFATVQCLLRAVKDGSLDERQFVPVVVLAGRVRRSGAAAAGTGQRGAVLAGLPARAGGLRHDPAVDAAGPGPDLYVPDVARRLRCAGAGERDADERGQCRKSPPRARGAICLAAACWRFCWSAASGAWRRPAGSPADVADTPLVRIDERPGQGHLRRRQKAADMQECLV